MARRLVGLLILVAAVLVSGGIWIARPPKAVEPSNNPQEHPTMSAESTTDRPTKTDADWRKVLTPEQYRITREKGTEAPFSGEYYKTDRQGTYRCVCCGAALFSSDTKFDAHCGWPSFWKPLENANIKYLEDHSLGMHRIEVQCKQCGAHLGHVFDDGPRPTGQRYCINSVSLKLEEKQPAPTQTSKQ
jgi:peptide-methionine (R)-S-oxide reductase